MQENYGGAKFKRVISALLMVGVALTMMGMGARPAEAEVPALLTWTWASPPYRLTTVDGADGRRYTRVTLEGYANARSPGAPALPVVGRLVALPPAGDFDLKVLEARYTTVPLAHPVVPAPAPADLTFDADGQPLPGRWTFARDATIYEGARGYPERFVTLEDPAWMRDLRLARLSITPFRYHPADQTLQVLHYLRLQIVPTDAATVVERAGTPSTSGPTIPRSVLLNPGDLDAFRASPPVAADMTAGVDPLAVVQAPGLYKVKVSVEGLYVLNYSMLAAAGLPLEEIEPTTLRLLHDEQEVAIQWEGDADATFEGNERLLFYARPQPTRYAGHDVYWLTWGGAAGRRMTSRSGDPTGVPQRTPWTATRIEKDIEYDSRHGGWNGQYWFWQKLKQPDLLSATLTLPLLHIPRTDTPATMDPWLEGITRDWIAPDHHVRFTLNGTYIGEGLWEGKTVYSATLPLTAGLLTAGDNALTLTLPDDLGGDIEAAWVDAITLTYGLDAVNNGTDLARFHGLPGQSGAYAVGGFTTSTLRVYDVSDPIAPVAVADWTFSDGVVEVADAGDTASDYLIIAERLTGAPQAIEAARSYSDPSGGGDYVIITPEVFQDAVAPLAAYRAGQGLRVVTVDVAALYDHFGDGRSSPQAIKAFLRHAYTAWPDPAPQYVLLVGDGTHDMQGFQPDSNPTYMPPYLAHVDPWLGETASDHQYADLTGDPLPELWVGRLPANTPEDVAAMVDKILTYETRPQVGDWNRQLLFAADNPSTAGDHHADADQDYAIYATPTYGYTGERVYLSETPGDPHLYTSATDARSALIGALDRGSLLYTYFGHSSWHQQAVLESDGYAPLFHRDHIAELDNHGSWPVVLQMTCYTSYFIHRTDDTLDESLLRTPDVGAVAVWGSSGNGVTPDHRVLHHHAYRAIFDEGTSELGAVVATALTGLYANGVSYDLIDTYHLLGDPATALRIGPDESTIIFLPVVMREG
jgi:hypothetical protein